MSSRAGSKIQPADVKRAAVITHGRPETIGSALERLRGLADERGVELLFPDEELDKHDLGSDDGDLEGTDLAVVLGGDGTMLRALKRFAAQRGRPMSQIALAWILRREEITSVIIGAQRPEQIEENVKAIGLRLSDSDLTRLDKLFGPS